MATTIKKRLESNIWKYTFYMVVNKRTFVSILGAYYLTIPDVTVQSIGLLVLISSLTGFVFEIPSGYFSDKFGHKNTLVLSRIVVIASTIFYLFAENFNFIVVASVLFALSNALHSGTGSAFMHDTFRALDREHDYTRVMGKMRSIGFAVPMILATTIPFLVSISFKLPFLVVLSFDIIGLLVTLFLVSPKVKPSQVEEVQPNNFKEVIRYGNNKGFFGVAFFMTITTGSLFAIGDFRSAYQAVLGVPVIWFGVLHSAGRLLASIALAYSGKIKDQFTLLSFLRFEMILFAGLVMLVGLSSNLYVILGLFILINGLHWGLSQVNNGFLLELIPDSNYKATLLSVQNQIRTVITAVAGLGLGYVINTSSYTSGFVALGVTMIALMLPTYFYLRHRHRP